MQCNFSLKKYTFKNIYSLWRNKSKAFTKYSALENPFTLNDEVFLRDYSYVYIYDNKGTAQFLHEHMIFVSNFFIRKLRNTNHIYIDGTFMYPKGFSQLIVILYIDEESGKRYPGLFALINNKKQEGYKYLFKKILDILTLENTSNKKILSYTIDFEKGLINATRYIFGEIRQIGCYYHYCRNIREEIRDLGLLKIEDLMDNTKSLLEDLYILPFTYYKDESIFNKIKEKYLKISKEYIDFLNYYNTQWIPYFKNGMLNYHYLIKEQRSNSYIENYNRRIKLKLSKYLYGKNHCKISWPLFLYFIKQEEEEYRTETFNNENELLFKYSEVKKIKKTKIIKKEQNNDEKQMNKFEKNINTNNDIKERLVWFKWKNNSCRYDCLILIYSILIMPKIKSLIITPENNIIEFLNQLCDKSLKLSEKEKKKGIWNFLGKNKDNFHNLTDPSMSFNMKGSCVQILNLLRYNSIFCCEYDLFEGCSKCNYNLGSHNYLSPYITYKEIDINKMELISNKYKELMKNEIGQCSKCGYDITHNIILDIKNPTYYRIYNNIKYPQFLFVIFDLSDINVQGINYDDLERIEYNRRIQYNQKIINILTEKIEFDNLVYDLKAIICTPSYDHFTCFLINVEIYVCYFEKNKIYYYDGLDSQYKVNIVQN